MYFSSSEMPGITHDLCRYSKFAIYIQTHHLIEFLDPFNLGIPGLICSRIFKNPKTEGNRQISGSDQLESPIDVSTLLHSNHSTRAV